MSGATTSPGPTGPTAPTGPTGPVWSSEHEALQDELAKVSFDDPDAGRKLALLRLKMEQALLKEEARLVRARSGKWPEQLQWENTEHRWAGAMLVSGLGGLVLMLAGAGGGIVAVAVLGAATMLVFTPAFGVLAFRAGRNAMAVYERWCRWVEGVAA